MIRNLLAGIGFLSVAMAGTAAVYATRWYHDGDDIARIAVSTRGLDLTTPEGQKALDQRVGRAVNRVCSSGSSYAYWGDRDCRRDARAGAEPQIRRAIDRAFDRRGTAFVEETIDPDGYGPTPVAPVPPYVQPVHPVYQEPTYVEPVERRYEPGARVLRDKRVTITRTPLKSRVIWVRTKDGRLVKKIVHRKLVRKTVRATYTR